MKSFKRADAIICGAGGAGIAVAYFLAQHGITDIVMIDKHPPLTQTSAKSGENYRNWWPDNGMVRFMNRSIDLMDELSNATDDVFNMTRRGTSTLPANARRNCAIISTPILSWMSEIFGYGTAASITARSIAVTWMEPMCSRIRNSSKTNSPISQRRYRLPCMYGGPRISAPNSWACICSAKPRNLAPGC